MRRRRTEFPCALLAFLTLAGALASAGEPLGARWEPVGLSGGGALFSAAISPADPLRMMVHCDMSAAYVTRDGGRSWRMVHHSQLLSCTRCRPAFHPTDPDTVISASGWEPLLKISRDGGETWENLATLPEAPCGEIAIDPENPSLLLVGGDRRSFLSRDGGRTWKECRGVNGASVGFHFDRTSPPGRRVCFAATAEGVWRSDDGGETWAEKARGLPWRGLRSFSGGSDAKAKKTVLFAAIPSREENGAFAGGVFRSEDLGETWEPAMGEGINKETKAFDQWAMGPVAQYHWVLGSNAKPASVWAFNANTGVPPPHHASAWRSDDAGRTWRATFQPDPRWKPFNVEADYTVCAVNQFYQDVPGGAAVNPNDPDDAMFVDGGRCYATRDGGKTWSCGHTILAPGQKAPGKDLRWLCNGLVVTTAWNYYVDPFQPARHTICYTDIGLARSEDAGKTWMWWAREGRAPWGNTCYELAFDPAVPGRVFGAFSDVHDIPNANVIMNRHRADRGGGVCRSDDFAKTWKPCVGLPDAPTTSIVLDPRSPPAARVLFAGFFGRGVWRSADGGTTWAERNEGLGAPENRRVCRVALHADGTLFALVTALVKDRVFQEAGVGLFRSKDGGGLWECMTRSLDLLWPKDFTVDPKDSRIVWLGAADGNRKEIGGLYRTVDGGASWKRIAREGREHFGAALHPKRPGWVYMTVCEEAPGAGLWLSRDGGATFQPVEGLPFRNAMRVAFDPKDDGAILVTTFGGSVWRGPADGGRPAEEKAPILVTGFEPFGGSTINPSWEAARLLDGSVLGGHKVLALQLRVIWGAPLPALREACNAHRPCLVVSLGQGHTFTCERIADNLRESYPDNAGNNPPAPRIVKDGPERLASGFPFEKVMGLYAGPKVRVLASEEAGGYLCEECLYSLETLRREVPWKMEAAFFHVPPLGIKVDVDGAKVRCTPELIRDFLRGVLLAWIANAEKAEAGKGR